MFSAILTLHLPCSSLAFWFLILNGFFMNSVGIPQPPKPPLCTPLSKVGNCSQLNRRVSVGVKNGRSLKKKKIKPTRGGIRPRDFFLFSLCLLRCCMQINQRRPIICLRIEGGFGMGGGYGQRGSACCSAQKHISHYLSCF